MNLADLMTGYSSTATLYTPSATDDQVVALANPYRWAIIFAPVTSLSTDPMFRADLQQWQAIQPSQWSGRIEFNNRDHPGLPQQQWIMQASPSFAQFLVIEIIQNPW